MSARHRRSLVFLLACAAPSGCIVGIADPRASGDDGGQPSSDGGQTSEASEASDAVDAPNASDAPRDAGGEDSATQGGDGNGGDAPAESTIDAPEEDVAAQDSPPVTQYLVFVTSTRYTGDLGGLVGADQKCMARAAAAMPSPLPGTFKAWLSDSTTSAAMHLTTHGTVPYVMVDGTVVAADWNALTSVGGAQVQNMITIDENGNTVPSSIDVCSGFGGHFVWTNSNDDGSLFAAAGTCQDLTSASSSDTGNTGSASNDQMSTQWWSSWCNGQACSSMASLYCIEQ